MSAQVSILDGPLAASSPGAYGGGAVICFEGVVRPTEDGRPVEALDYEVYEPMAQHTLEQLAGQAVSRFGLLVVEVEHSRGRVPAGACSFRLRVTSSHRAAALEATAWFIDRMKQEAPIWKHAVWAGTTEVTP